MYVEKPVLEIEKDLFAAAADPENSRACKCACRLRLITTSDPARVEFGVVNRSPDEMRAQGPNDGFDFWKFGQAG